MDNPFSPTTTTKISPPLRFELDDFMALSYEERIKVSRDKLPDEILCLRDDEIPLGIKYGIRRSPVGGPIRVGPHGLA